MTTSLSTVADRFLVALHEKPEVSEEHGLSLLRNLPSLYETTEILLTCEQAPVNLVHHFGPGVCIREITVPAGTLAVGHVQKKEHLNVLLRGKVMILTDQGEVKILEAPLIFTGKPGRKVGYILEEMVWQNIYPTDKKTVEEIEEEFIEKSELWDDFEFLTMAEKFLDHEIDREDYKRVIEEDGLTEEEVQAQVNYPNYIPITSPNTRIYNSPIHGKGLFLTNPVKAGDIIMEAYNNGFRTQAGRYINHSKYPNCCVVVQSGVAYIKALVDIPGTFGGSPGTELTIDYSHKKETTNLLENKS